MSHLRVSCVFVIANCHARGEGLWQKVPVTGYAFLRKIVLRARLA
jgi:hypothetical protein